MFSPKRAYGEKERCMIKQGFTFALMVLALFTVSFTSASETGKRSIDIPALPFAVVELFTSEG
jgi:hypothetical protein